MNRSARSVPLSTRDLRLDAGERTLCARLDLRLEAGQCWGILGRNGAGKTTLLHTLAGLRQARHGQVLLEERALRQWGRRALARRLGLLLQEREPAFPATLLQTVLSGRYAHLGAWGRSGAQDLQLARQAIEQMELTGLEQRNVQTLSGGERQRAAIAQLLTQSPDILLLDEPASHLDLHQQVRVLDLFRQLADAGRCVAMSLHDPNQALRHCTHLLILHRGRALCGPVGQLGRERLLSRVFAHPLARVQGPRGAVVIPR